MAFRYPNKSYLIACCILVAACLPHSGYAADAVLKFVAHEPGNHHSLSLVIDHAERIAGMKITLRYDKDRLVFKQATKAPATSSFMHVVNDKVPGQLIIVMASAKGVSGDNLSLLHLEFADPPGSEGLEQTISVTQIQLMDDSLREIPGNLPQYSF